MGITMDHNTAIIVLFILGQGIAVIKAYIKVEKRLTRIETKLGIDDK